MQNDLKCYLKLSDVHATSPKSNFTPNRNPNHILLNSTQYWTVNLIWSHVLTYPDKFMRYGVVAPILPTYCNFYTTDSLVATNQLDSGRMESICLCLLSRGVFQSLVEKHFPAPDRRKMFDLLTMNSSSGQLFDDSPAPSPSSTASSAKRKADSSGMWFSYWFC